LLFSSAGTIYGATGGIKRFKGNWAEKQITSWIDKGLTNGYSDGTFKNRIIRLQELSL